MGAVEKIIGKSLFYKVCSNHRKGIKTQAGLFKKLPIAVYITPPCPVTFRRNCYGP